MGLKVAVATGNWSNPATWNGGLLPKVGDIVASNNFTVTIDQNINVRLLTNTVQTGVSSVPVMTSATTPSGIVTSSGNYDAARAAWNAFAASGIWISGAGSFPPQWIAYEFTSPKIIGSYSFNSGWALSAMPKDFLFQGWNGSSWVTLHTVTGNTSTTYTSPSIGNTTAYISYRFYTTAINQTNPQGDQFVSMAAIKMFESGDFSGSSVAGGGFILNSGVTVTTTGATGLSASSSLIDFPSNGTATINCGTGNIVKPTTSTATLYTIRVSGGGTLNVTGNISSVSSNSRTILINTTAGATLNFTGNITPGTAPGIETAVSCTVSIVGNIIGTTSNGPLAAVDFLASGTLNITGNIFGSNANNNDGFGVRIGLGNLNITGNVYGSTNNPASRDYGVSITNNATVYITGNIYGGTSLVGASHWGLFTSSAIYLNQVGGIYSGYNIGGLSSTNANAIHILSGPFVCSEYGFFPYQLVRMNLIPTSNSYFEFRDETTNGALQPGAIAPAARLLSPASVSNAPSASNVRFGTVYAFGSQTGTVRMPHPNNVSYGVPVDNTFGTAVLSPQDVWNYARTNLTTPGSIGERLKNVSTVDTTGDQLTALL